MLSSNIDLGQIIVASMIGIIGFFVKRTMDKVDGRLDKAESAIIILVGDVQRLIGRIEANGIERRKNSR